MDLIKKPFHKQTRDSVSIHVFPVELLHRGRNWRITARRFGKLYVLARKIIKNKK